MEPEWRASGGRSGINKLQFKELLNIVVNTYECNDTLPQKNCFLLQFGKLLSIKREFITEYSCFKKG
jgi:hypothetical protein